jgi:hypothetical protein
VADKGDEVFVTRGLLIRMHEPPVGDGDYGRRGADRSHAALRACTPSTSPNTATVVFTNMSVWVCQLWALRLFLLRVFLLMPPPALPLPASSAPHTLSSV